MGEYVLVDGVMAKIGTMEDLYYVRYADYRRLFEAGRLSQAYASDLPESYLDGGSRFRFPFPDEDQVGAFRYDNYGRGVLVDVRSRPELVSLATHGKMTLPVMPDGTDAYYTSIRIPCPATAEFAEVRGEGVDWRLLRIAQQRPIDGQLWTICDCPYCHVKWRLDAVHAGVLDVVLRTLGDTFHDELARRMLAGYQEILQTLAAVSQETQHDKPTGEIPQSQK